MTFGSLGGEGRGLTHKLQTTFSQEGKQCPSFAIEHRGIWYPGGSFLAEGAEAADAGGLVSSFLIVSLWLRTVTWRARVLCSASTNLAWRKSLDIFNYVHMDSTYMNRASSSL